MRSSLPMAFAACVFLSLSPFASAHTGPLVGGEPPELDLNVLTMDELVNVHDETVNNPGGDYKGWWWVSLTNNTGISWTAVDIAAGAGDLVALVQANGLEDEWGFVGNSIVGSPAGSVAYSGSLGSRLYDNGVTGQLWTDATYTFTSPVAVGAKAAFRIYTDNSYYGGPYADSFCVCLTPIPEPATISVLGLAGLVGLVRRRKRK